jgi:type VI secretion system protein ImpM
MSAAPLSPILFGKLPAHGDFVARGLSPARRDQLDRWLADEMARGLIAHGDAFADRFDIAPVWRFSMPEAEGGWISGALAPSADAVGRRFPLLAAMPSVGHAEACEDLLYLALTEDWNAERLVLALAESRPGHQSTRTGWWFEGNDDFPEAALSGARPSGLIVAMTTPREVAA